MEATTRDDTFDAFERFRLAVSPELWLPSLGAKPLIFFLRELESVRTLFGASGVTCRRHCLHWRPRGLFDDPAGVSSATTDFCRRSSFPEARRSAEPLPWAERLHQEELDR